MRRLTRIGMMLAVALAVVVLTSGCSLPTATEPNQIGWNFDGDESGILPIGWSQHQWGEGATHWAVQDCDSEKVFAQLASENPNKHFNLAVYDPLLARNATLTVKFRAVSGKHDQGGGLVWRYQDEQNHYIVRANPLENNVVLYKMQDGVRIDLPLAGIGRTYGVEVGELGNLWHTLKLRAVEDEFTVSLDGLELFRVRDQTFLEAGRVGLWTKADAVTWFDDFVVRVE